MNGFSKEEESECHTGQPPEWRKGTWDYVIVESVRRGTSLGWLGNFGLVFTAKSTWPVVDGVNHFWQGHLRAPEKGKLGMGLIN